MYIHKYVSQQAEHAERSHHTSGAAGGAVHRPSVCTTSFPLSSQKAETTSFSREMCSSRVLSPDCL